MRRKFPHWISSRLDPIELLLRLIVGGVFLDSGWGKALDPLSFSDTVRSYQILADPWAAWLAMALPPFLLITGFCLILRVLYPGVVFAAAGALAGFVVALVSLSSRGLDVECGCLSFAFPVGVQILIDVLLVALCAVLARMAFRRSGAS